MSDKIAGAIQQPSDQQPHLGLAAPFFGGWEPGSSNVGKGTDLKPPTSYGFSSASLEKTGGVVTAINFSQNEKNFDFDNAGKLVIA